MSSSSNVLLYASNPAEYAIAMAAAEITGLPQSAVTGSFATAWSMVKAGSALTIAVGAGALYALYYNPCNWSNPDSLAGGYTPFKIYVTESTQKALANYFINGAGTTAIDTLKRSVMLTAWAVYGAYPTGFTTIPLELSPSDTCLGGLSPNQTCIC